MKFYIKKLGCPKNDVDGDFITARLIESGHEPVDIDTDADIVIVNTCGFILPAREESINEILQYEALKKKGIIKRLFVTGCLSQRYGADSLSEIEGIDAVFGLGNHDDIVKAINNGDNYQSQFEWGPKANIHYIAGKNRYVDTTYPYEYIKISDGCDRFCAYCAIPYIRGRYRSRHLADIVNEAKYVVSKGKKEIILVSQEGTAYGRDFKDDINIISLLSELEKINGIEWIRLMYLHPESVTDRLIEYMASSHKVLDYFDIPLQHISDRILRLMNRRITRVEIESLLKKIRSMAPAATIRTSFIAGLPGETEEEFAEQVDFITAFEFDRLGVFAYSREEGTPASEWEGQHSENVINDRQDRMMAVQQEIAFRKNIALIGTTQQVIIDRIETGSSAVGRTRGDCPDIDQVVFIDTGKVRVGDMVDVRITMSEGYDLVATTENI